jgi:hypothetical protein
MMSAYPAVVEKEGKLFVLRFPDFEESMVAGVIGQDSPEAVGRMCLLDTICFRLKNGYAIPAPSPVLDNQLTITIDNIVVGETDAVIASILNSLASVPNGVEPKEHGFDSHTIIKSNSPYMSIYFKGGRLGKGAIPFSLFRNMIDQTYLTIKRVFFPVFDKYSSFGISETTINKILQIPVREPRFASLSLEIEKPTLDTKMLRKSLDIDLEDFSRNIDNVGSSFFTSISAMKVFAENGQYFSQDMLRFARELDAVADILPDDDASFDWLEISRYSANGQKQTVSIDSQIGGKLKYAHARFIKEKKVLTGRVVEVSERSNSFMIRIEGGREVTCKLFGPNLRIGNISFREKMLVTVSGTFQRRPKRDLLNVESLTLPNGVHLQKE